MIDFTGQVAVVTGAGRGLGRLYALDLAHRGASVVVNDLGSSMRGDGVDSGVADDVVDEIKKAGGTAIASYDSVDSPAGGQAISTLLSAHSGGSTRSSVTRESSAVRHSKTSRPTSGPACCACISTAAFFSLSPLIAR